MSEQQLDQLPTRTLWFTPTWQESRQINHLRGQWSRTEWLRRVVMLGLATDQPKGPADPDAEPDPDWQRTRGEVSDLRYAQQMAQKERRHVKVLRREVGHYEIVFGRVALLADRLDDEGQTQIAAELREALGVIP